MGSIPALGRSPRERKWQATLVFLPGKALGQRSLAYYSPSGCKSKTQGFPGGPVVKSPPASAGDMGSIPGPTCSRATNQCTTATEVHAPGTRAPQQEKPPQREAYI